MSIPDAGADSPLFHRVSEIQLGPSKDRVYVLDQFRNSIRVFDLDGNLVREFAGEGEGPDELMLPGGLRFVGDRLHVRDGEANRIIWFDRHGEYLGSRTSAGHYPEPDAETIQRSRGQAVMRHDQVLAHHGGEPGRAMILLLDEADVLIDTVFNYGIGGTYVRTRSRPERWSRVTAIPSFGVGGYWTPINDSLVASVDHRHGTVEWHNVGVGVVSLVRRRTIGFAPQPVPVTEAEMRMRAAEALRVPRGEILEIDIPSFEAQLLSSSFGDRGTGDVWVRRRPADAQSGSPVQHWILVPFDESAPMLELELPRDFQLWAAEHDLLLGVHVDPDTEVESVRVYRWRVR